MNDNSEPITEVQGKKDLGLLYYYTIFKAKLTNKLQVLASILFILLCVSLFKNISYPLIWADEGATVMGTSSIMKFGYPKAHDGKNVLNFQPPIGEHLLFKEGSDAWIGEGSNWSMYYFGVIGYRLAESTNDLYLKTGIYRSTYAFLSLLGLFIIVFSVSKIFNDKFSKYLFISFYLFLELTAISVVLILREIRYYPLAMFFSALAVSGYIIFRFYKPYNKILYVAILSIVLWILFNTFLPAGFIIFVSIGISEFFIAIYNFIRTKNIKKSILSSIIPLLPLLVSLIAAIPIFSYFNTFEWSSALSKYYGYNSDMYWFHVSSVFSYFRNFEPFWLEVGLKLLILLSIKKCLNENSSLFKISNFLFLFFIVYVFSISRVYQLVFTRYFIILQPFFSIMIVLDFFILIRLYSRSIRLAAMKITMLILFVSSMIGYNFYRNLPNLKGHLYEITHQYKGPLDYTIPYIKNNFKRTDTLLLAINDEESSYIYYLGCKVTLGYIAMDSITQPDVIAFRTSMGPTHSNLFNNFLTRKPYIRVNFPVQDVFCNNIPELNYPVPSIHHLFETPLTNDPQLQTSLFVLSSIMNSKKK